MAIQIERRKSIEPFTPAPRSRSVSQKLRRLWRLFNRQTISLLLILFCAGLIGAWISMAQLSESLIQTQAIDSVSRYADAIQEARTLYAEQVVGRIKAIPGVTIAPNYAATPGSIPVPATYLIELAHHITAKNPGMKVRLYSDFPFPDRIKTGGARDDFERNALIALRQNPDQPYIRFEPFQGSPALRFARADVMKPTCVACHNTLPSSPKKDWRVGDVRGALEITTPLDRYTSSQQNGLRNLGAMLGGFSLLAITGILLVISRLRQTSHELELRVADRTQQLHNTNIQLSEEQAKAEQLLLNILPSTIASQLKDGHRRIANGFDSATILFADLVGFTEWSETVAPAELVYLLNDLFCRFDRLTEQLGLEKIKTIGDAYMVVGGLPHPRPDHTRAVATMALAMRNELDQFNQQYQQSFQLRIGIHTGPVIAGVIGTKKFIYDLWGDTVNIASRMESHGIAGEIQVTQATYTCLRGQFEFTPRGPIAIKGKGNLETYLLIRELPLIDRTDTVESRDRSNFQTLIGSTGIGESGNKG